MRKKIVSIALAFVLVIGLGNVVLAHNGSENHWSYDEILPHMKQMHPEMNERDLEKMYKDCHGSGSSNETVAMNNKL
ncbi:MAG TPA: hypothetical protein VK105_18280 [Virgibacillus sp.]|nr:hypothetical protein [Virgibacillus sp.]HLR69034.1 hypothetical protein [Virgibacillus sp.]